MSVNGSPELPILKPSKLVSREFSSGPTEIEARADGVIVDVHRAPAEALSDASQRLPTAEFAQLAAELDALRAALAEPPMPAPSPSA